jgi:hypothetical protein
MILDSESHISDVFVASAPHIDINKNIKPIINKSLALGSTGIEARRVYVLSLLVEVLPRLRQIVILIRMLLEILQRSHAKVGGALC